MEIESLYHPTPQNVYYTQTQGLHTHSGIAKAGPGRACAWPKHHVRPTHVMRSRAKCFVRVARIQQVPSQYQSPGYATAYTYTKTKCLVLNYVHPCGVL